MTKTLCRGALALIMMLATAAGVVSPAAGQIVGRDTLGLSLARALEIGRQENPQVRQAGFQRSAAGAGLWDAYGNLLPNVGLQGQAQRTEQGSFAFFGTEFESPETYSTAYQWDFTHSLLDSGRDLFRIKGARADVDRAIAAYDLQWWETRAEIARQYLTARRGQALVQQAEREVERLAEHLRLAEARYEVGAVTKSDILQARLSLNRGEVAALEARQVAQEALLALRTLLGGELPDAPLALTSDFDVFNPAFNVDNLVARALEVHPSLREVEAQEAADAASLWIARSAYLPGLQFQYSLSRSVIDTSGFSFSEFDDRNFYALSLNWQLFDGFDRHNQISQANAALESARAEERRRALSLEETVRAAHSRLMTAHAAHRANLASVELAEEDLELGEGRYRTGAGSFVDLLDARVRAAQAETDLIASTYDFFLALVQLELGTGLELFPAGAAQ